MLASAEGSVRYGRAFAVDSTGRTDLDSAWEDGAIRIRVPAARVAAATWPLVVDPIVTTFDVDTGVEEDLNPDVAYDASTGNHIVVYERVFSAADHDLIYHIVDENGVFVHLGDFDITSANWANPHVASNGLLHRFLCVAEVGAVGSRTIRCRYRDAAGNGAQGNALTVSGAETGDKSNPDVGGNPNASAPAYFLVTWQRDFSPTDQDVHARLVTGGGALAAGVMFLSNSGGTLDIGPSVSKSCGMSVPGSSPRWTVAWVRSASTFDNDLMGAVIRDDGAILNPPFDIDTTSANTTWPSVSSPTHDASRTTLVVATRQISAFGDRNTFGWAMNGATMAAEANLTFLSGAPNGEEQYYPSVDCDGESFVVVDQESYQGTLDYDIRASTFFWAANELVLIDGHRYLAFGTPVDRVPEVACAGAGGGPRRRTMAVWQRGLGSSDILGAIYEPSPFTQLCTPGSSGVSSCPCGNAPAPGVRGCNNSSGTGGANLYASGNVDPDTVVLVATQMQPTTLCLFVQGTGFLANGAVFGDGIRCVSGSLVRLATKQVFGGNAWFPINNDPSITQRSAAAGAPITPGTPRYYFVYYRDAGGYACPSTFNTSNVARVIW